MMEPADIDLAGQVEKLGVTRSVLPWQQQGKLYKVMRPEFCIIWSGAIKSV